MSPGARSRSSRVALDDTAVVVPVRIDSPDRLRNLDIVLAWLARSFTGQTTLVLEHDVTPRAGALAGEHGAEHVFLRSDGCFHKSRVFNLGLALAERPFALLYDCDVLVPAAAVGEALQALRRDEADYVYPYNGVMLEIRTSDSAPRGVLDAAFLGGMAACTGSSLDELPAGATHLNGTLEEPSTGGALACKRRTLLLHGGFNPNIMSYGCEDTELETRIVKLGGRVARLPSFNCFHIHHRRGADSRYNGFHAANLAEWKKVEAMSAAEATAYVQNGFRSLVLDAGQTLELVDTPARFSIAVTAKDAASLSDTAFVVMLDADPALPSALVTALIDEIEKAYAGYLIHLVERDGYRYRSVSHRDHVVYEAVRDQDDQEVLHAVASELDRPRVVVSSVFLDTRPEPLGRALESLRGGAAAAVPLATSNTSRERDTRAAKVLDALRTRLGSRSRAFAFDRARLVAWLGDASAHDLRWDAILETACGELAGRNA